MGSIFRRKNKDEAARNNARQQREDPRQPPPAGYYYSSSSSSRAAPSPSFHQGPPSRSGGNLYSAHNGLDMPSMGTPRSREGLPPPRHDMIPPGDESTPSYHVEHLATFAVGQQYGLRTPADGIRKLQEMERRSAIWAQSMVLRLRQNVVSVEDDNGQLVESFPMELVEQPTAHLSNDPREQYNNILLFVVVEDPRNKRSANPTEMHIFQCNRVSATDLVEDLQHYIRGQWGRVKPGRRTAGLQMPATMYNNYQGAQMYADNASVHSEGSEQFEIEVNTLNRCFDDIERFMARIQAAFLAQQQLQEQAKRNRSTANRKGSKGSAAYIPPDPHGILAMRSRLPSETEFVDIFRKFKLCFNLLAKLKNHIHDPNAPELLHFLFQPLTGILDACHRGHGRPVAPQVVSPLISLEARELMQNCLSSKEMDVWMSMGDAWRTPPEDWTGNLPQAYRPVFIDGFAPYGLPETAAAPPNVHPQYSSSTMHNQPAPLHRGESAPPAHYRGREEHVGHHRGRSIDVGGVQSVPGTPISSRRAAESRGWSPSPSQRGVPQQTNTATRRPPRHHSVDNVRDLDLDRINFERERVEFEKMMLEKERRLLDEEKTIRAEKSRLDAERKLLHEEAERRSLASNHFNPNTNSMPSPRLSNGHSSAHQPAPTTPHNDYMAAPSGVSSPRERAFLDDLLNRGAKVVQVIYDRTSMNSKELSVHKFEYLEVLNDSKNWWECKNNHSRVGYVPHTILTVMSREALENAQYNGGGGDQYGQRGSDHSVYRAPSSPSHGGPQASSHHYNPPYPTHQSHLQSHPQSHHPSPSPTRNQRFVVVSEAGVQADRNERNERYGDYARIQTRSPSPPPRVPEPPAPPPIAGLNEAIEKMKRQEMANRAARAAEAPKLNVIKRIPKITKQEEALLMEINSTLTRGEGRKILIPKRTEPTVEVADGSSSTAVNNWLVDRGFSPRTIEILSDMDGAMLFSLSRNKLIEVCGREEGSRVYSQMLVQKKRSAYATKTGQELAAILNHRKINTDAKNEMPSEEPATLVVRKANGVEERRTAV